MLLIKLWHYKTILFQIHEHEDIIKMSPLILMDANISTKAIEATLELADKHNVPGKVKHFTQFQLCFIKYN